MFLEFEDDSSSVKITRTAKSPEKILIARLICKSGFVKFSEGTR